jgi:hypothetical protein
MFREYFKWLFVGFPKYLFAKKSPDYSWFQVLRCRWTGHSNAGPIWYNSQGLEPDMTCKGCGDTLI